MSEAGPAAERPQPGKPDWAIEGRDWPNRAASRFVSAGGLRFHVQRFGQGPTLLLLHGTGAATHSWRALAPRLAEHFDVIAPDLPGHGFTDTLPSRRMSLDGFAQAIAALLDALDARPVIAVGHSAGAAIALRMTLDGRIAPRLVVSLNGALLPFRGLAAHLFAPLARVFVANSVVPRLFARRAADDRTVQRLLRDTGSAIDRDGLALYGRLLRRPGHIAGALAMMANWDLEPLDRDLPRLATPLVLVAGGRDRTIRPDEAFRVRERVPGSIVRLLPNVGHLAHEEQPQMIADLIVVAAREAALLDHA